MQNRAFNKDTLQISPADLKAFEAGFLMPVKIWITNLPPNPSNFQRSIVLRPIITFIFFSLFVQLMFGLFGMINMATCLEWLVVHLLLLLLTTSSYVRPVYIVHVSCSCL